jgi:hypothetical protein
MIHFSLVAVLAVTIGAIHWITQKKLNARIKSLEQELQTFSDVVVQLVEIQTQSHSQVTTSLEDLEERLLDMSVPSQDANSALERRHKVLTLARQGVSAEDISKRLGTPVGEAELMLKLRKFRGANLSNPIPVSQKVNPYAQI